MRNTFSKQEVELLVHAAKSSGADSILRSVAVYEAKRQHDRARRVAGWPLRTVGSIWDKLRRIARGIEQFPGITPTRIALKRNKRVFPASFADNCPPGGDQWQAYQRKLRAIEEEYQQKKIEIREEFVKTLA